MSRMAVRLGKVGKEYTNSTNLAPRFRTLPKRKLTK
jgi:hypothetical protein